MIVARFFTVGGCFILGLLGFMFAGERVRWCALSWPMRRKRVEQDADETLARA